MPERIVQIKGYILKDGTQVSGPSESVFYANPETYMVMTDEGAWQLGFDGWLRLTNAG